MQSSASLYIQKEKKNNLSMIYLFLIIFFVCFNIIDNAIKTNGTNFLVNYVLRLPTFNVTSFFPIRVNRFPTDGERLSQAEDFFSPSGRNPPVEELCIA